LVFWVWLYKHARKRLSSGEILSMQVYCFSFQSFYGHAVSVDLWLASIPTPPINQ